MAKAELKKELLKKLQKKPKKIKIINESKEKIVYVDKSFNFGNCMILLNNLLYYCEILNISTIYLNSKAYWPISDNFTSNKVNIILANSSLIDKKENNIYELDKKLIFFQKLIRPEIRIHLLKKEINILF